MLINEVTKQTGLTRKAVYFYVEQGFVRPVVLEPSGYRDYSKEDVQRLRLIGRLRALDLSIAEIRSLLETGGRLDIPLHRVLEAKEEELRRALTAVYQLRNVLDRMPPNTKLSEFSELLLRMDLEKPHSFELMPEENQTARKTTLLLWEAALDVEQEGVVSRLWPRLVEEMRKNQRGMESYEAYYSRFDDTQLEKDYWGRRGRVTGLSSCPPERYGEVAAEQANQLRFLAGNGTLQEAWRDIYHTVTLPLLRFSAPMNDMVQAYNPVFAGYSRTLAGAYQLIASWLEEPEGRAVRETLRARLGECMPERFEQLVSMLDYYCYSLFCVILPEEMQELSRFEPREWGPC